MDPYFRDPGHPFWAIGAHGSALSDAEQEPHSQVHTGLPRAPTDLAAAQTGVRGRRRGGAQKLQEAELSVQRAGWCPKHQPRIFSAVCFCSAEGHYAAMVCSAAWSLQFFVSLQFSKSVWVFREMWGLSGVVSDLGYRSGLGSEFWV